MDAKTISKGTIPTLNTLSSAPDTLNSGEEELSAAAPANSFAMSMTINAIVATNPSPATSEVAVVTVLAVVVVVVVVVTVVTVEINSYPSQVLGCFFFSQGYF